MFNGIYEGKKILVTGHCGFKGSWLCLWLKRLGVKVIGYGHVPRTEPNHHDLLGIMRPELIRIAPEFRNPARRKRQQSTKKDLLAYGLLKTEILRTQPDLIIHLAAKAIVARTFTEPRETFENNIMGAVNILEAVRQCPSVKGVVMITSDKVYLDQNFIWGYREEGDELGGVDPYSASKVCVEQVIKCYRESFGLNIATARAGNVIGGGDWAEKRLIPDIVRAASKGEKVVIHTPTATRPFQHVLEPLCGYLMLGQRILEGKDVNGAWNFGPDDEMTVLQVLETAKDVWPAIEWEVDNEPTHPHMVYLLKIDSAKARKELGWRPVWSMERAVTKTIMWYHGFYRHGLVQSNNDIDDYERQGDFNA